MPDEQKCHAAAPVSNHAPTVVHVGTQQAAAPQGINTHRK